MLKRNMEAYIDPPVNAGGHQGVVAAHLQRHRPVGSQIGVRAVKQSQSCSQRKKPQNVGHRMERILRPFWKSRGHPDHGKNRRA